MPEIVRANAHVLSLLPLRPRQAAYLQCAHARSVRMLAGMSEVEGQSA